MKLGEDIKSIERKISSAITSEIQASTSIKVVRILSQVVMALIATGLAIVMTKEVFQEISSRRQETCQKITETIGNTEPNSTSREDLCESEEAISCLKDPKNIPLTELCAKPEEQYRGTYLQ